MAKAIMYEEEKYYKSKKIDFKNLLAGLQAASDVVKEISDAIRDNGGAQSVLLRSILPMDKERITVNNGEMLEHSAVSVGVGLGTASRTFESAAGCAFPSDLTIYCRKRSLIFQTVINKSR